MVKINIICIGKIKDKYIRDGISEFSKRLSRYANLNIIELAEEDDNKGIGTAITKETERIIDALNKRNRSYSILLDLKGKLKSSEEMAEEIENKIKEAVKEGKVVVKKKTKSSSSKSKGKSNEDDDDNTLSARGLWRRSL